MNIALLLPFSPSAGANSGVARLEMFRYFPNATIDRYHFGSASGKDISIGDYYPEANPRNFRSYFRLLRAFGQKHRAQPYDVIWTTMPPILMALFARMIARRYRLPLVVDVRDPGIASAIIFLSETSSRYRIAHRLENWLYRGAEKICVTTPELADLLEKEFSVDKIRTVIISNAADKKITTPNNLNPKKVRVFYAGTFAPYQVVDPLVDNLLKAHLPEFTIDLYGYEEAANPALTKKIENAKATSWLRLHPRLPRTQLFEKLKDYDIVLVPIEFKGKPELYDYAVPLKLYEALAFSKPIVLFGGTAASKRVVSETKIGEICSLNQSLYPVFQKIVTHYPDYKKAATKTVFSREEEGKKLYDVIRDILTQPQ